MNKTIFAIILVFILVSSFGCTQANTQNNTGNNNQNNTGTSADTNYGTVTQTDTNNPSAGLTHNVRIANLNFNPTDITINVGDTVSWRNEDAAAHSVTSNTGFFDSGAMAQGVIFEQEFTFPGTYDYHCTFHAGMNGRVIVQ
ncbi:MAG: plastocyanin/azurin family copper-binding protein [archaeon]|jgi:plastocyanin